MSYTPFEREMLREQKRTNELLELLVMAHQPMKLMTGVAPVEPAKGVPIEEAFAAAGILPMVRRPGSGQPETSEQRAERFAARAKEVGLPEERVAEVSGRVQLNLDSLTQPGIVGVQTDSDGNLLVDVVSDPPAPAKKAPAKKAARPAK